MNRKLLKALIIGGVIFILAILPVIPVMRAAVVPNPVYRLLWVSFFGLLVSFFQVGVSYQFGWYSLATLVLLLGISWFLQRLLVEKLVGGQ